MHTYRARIAPLSAFGTRPLGDTLFGQMCWAIRNRFGEARLTELLAGYTDDRPFAVISDAFPTGHLPRPSLPGHSFDEVEGEDRKVVKKRAWLPLENFATPVAAWLTHCKTAAELSGGAPTEHPQPHNTISRATGTTGEGQFAPYAMNQLWYCVVPQGRQAAPPEVLLDVYIVLDEARMSADDLRTVLIDIGHLGFGRDASIGLGKFRLDDWTLCELPTQIDPNTWLTLAPCAPQGGQWREEHCFYQPFTRFGRHGDMGVHLGNPFKAPVLLAMTGAVLTPRSYQHRPFVGVGLGGDGSLSKSIPRTVHQGYAPVAAIRLPEKGPREIAA